MSTLTTRLQNAFYFNEQDLAENNNARLSERQKKILASKRKLYLIAYSFFVFVMLASVALVGYSSTSLNNAAIWDDLGFQIVGAVCLAIIGIYTPFFLHDLAALNVASLKKAEGKLHLELASEANHFKAIIGRETLLFPACEPFLSAFEEGESYRIYFIPAKRSIVLSAKALSDKEGEFEKAEIVQHPGLVIAKRAPLFFAIFLTAMVSGPLLMMFVNKLARRAEVSGLALDLVNLTVIVIFGLIYLTVILRIVHYSSSSSS